MKNDEFSELVKAALDHKPQLSLNFEGRVMIAIAREAILQTRRRARFSLTTSLAGISLAAAACVTAVVMWFPTQFIISVDVGAILDGAITGLKALLR